MNIILGEVVTKNGNKYCNINLILRNKEVINFKKEIIKVVHANSKRIFGIQKTINIIEDLYCNSIGINTNNTNIHITGLWFANKSWGTYFDYIITHTNDFIDSDSDSELDLILK
jgi:hypothetical protein